MDPGVLPFVGRDIGGILPREGERLPGGSTGGAGGVRLGPEATLFRETPTGGGGGGGGVALTRETGEGPGGGGGGGAVGARLDLAAGDGPGGGGGGAGIAPSEGALGRVGGLGAGLELLTLAVPFGLREGNLGGRRGDDTGSEAVDVSTAEAGRGGGLGGAILPAEFI